MTFSDAECTVTPSASPVLVLKTRFPVVHLVEVKELVCHGFVGQQAVD